MASMDQLTARRMHYRHAIPHQDRSLSVHAALGMFLTMLAVMLMVAAMYYYAAYSADSSQFDTFFGLTPTQPHHSIS